MLFGTLLPLMQKMHGTLDDKQMRATAYETMHEAAKTILATGRDSGERTINGTVFSWNYDTALCVEYKNYRDTPETICAE
ncbi:hypothetical protein DHX103_15760 [Planococcus sp. X10-3]|uniref:hypothetical protein n=1 Tax=Planococcus sp. X10-3 TaxID=3061240 RepID=UPI003BB1230D